MSQPTNNDWPLINRFAFRLFSVYILFYILFISDFLWKAGEILPFLKEINRPFKYISTAFGRWTYQIFFHKSIPPRVPIHFMDTSWNIVAATSFFLVAILIAIVWTLFEKRKNHSYLIKFTHAVARYYLAFILFVYGFIKFFDGQFSVPPSPTSYLGNLTEMDPHRVLWFFMSSSKAYPLFAGLMEIVPGILLLFRRTSVIGAFLAIAALINILLLDISFDVPLKFFLFNLIIIGIYIIAPYLKSLFSFFLKAKPVSLFIIAPIVENKKYKWVHYIFKSGLVIFFILFNILPALERRKEKENASPVVGLHEIKEWTTKTQTPDSGKSKLSWKRIAIDPLYWVGIQFTDGSVANFNKRIVSATNVQFSEWDSTFTCNLHYSDLKDGRWLFEGTMNKDSLRFISSKIDLSQTTHQKGIGKIKWIYN